MDIKVDQPLLARFFKKQCSPEEAAAVYRWLQDADNEAKISSAMQDRWHQVMDELATAEAPVSTDLRNTPHPKARQLSRIMERKNRFRFSQLAAVILLLVLSGAVFFWLSRDQWQPKQQQEQVAVLMKATLKGQKLTFQLEDGTKVMLNTDSRLYYPASFYKEERWVRLEGEAFFEVAKNKQWPFRVVSDSIVTTALGTAFNVLNPDTSQPVIVSLVEGKVVVARTGTVSPDVKQVLSPGESAIYNKQQQSIQKDTTGIQDLIAWKDGVLILKNADVDQVVNTLESWYDVYITLVNKPAKDWTYTGEFRKESLENVLKGISFSKNINYSIRGKEVKITFK